MNASLVEVFSNKSFFTFSLISFIFITQPTTFKRIIAAIDCTWALANKKFVC